MITIKFINRLAMIGILCGQLICTSCIHAPTINKPIYAPFLYDQPISNEDLQKIEKESPKDAVFADLLQAFALMRTGDLNKANTRKEILGLLATSVSSFEDMTDPVNFSSAFSLDEDKAYRGRPHERMFASTMAGVFLMAENRCGEALPYLRNAEFLDARFQKMPFGTDAPLIYALMYRCLIEQKADKHDIDHAKSGVFRSVRFLTLQETLIEALVEVAQLDLRHMAFTRRLAYMIYEISLYHSLITAPEQSDIDTLIDDAAKHADLFIAALSSHFNDEYRDRMRPLVEELAKVYGLNKKSGTKNLEELAFERIALESKDIGEKIKLVFSHRQALKDKVRAQTALTHELTGQILKSAAANTMILTFSGMGPKVVREGSYEEISTIKPGTDATTKPSIRHKTLKLNEACGFHRRAEGGFSVVMCKSNNKESAEIASMPNLELLSLSRKATTAQGRQFDKILKGRAQFREATENIAEVSAWSAFFLFYLGSAMISDCQRRGESEACYTKGFVVWGIAGITVLFSGTVWLIGRSSNPAADSRYIHLMYESVWLAI
jgi:hypothetical protein